MRIPFRQQTMSCQQLVELVTGYLDRSLSPRLQRAIDAHVAECTECTEYLAQMRRTQQLTGALAFDTPVPDEMLDALATAFNQAVLDQQPDADHEP